MLGQFGFRRGPPVTDGAAASSLYFAGAGRHLDRLLYRCECRCHVQRLVNHRADAVVEFRAFPVRLRLRTSDRRLSHVPDHPAHQLHRWRAGRFNYQFGSWSPASKPTFRLCRREAPYRRRFNPAPPPANFSAPVFGTATVARRLDYLGTARGRLGCPLVLRCSMQRAVWLTAAPILPYTGTIGYPIAPTVVLSGTSSNSRTSLGYALGGGLEYAFWKNWSIKAEYLYYNLGRHSTTISGSFTNFAPPTGGFSTASLRDDGHIVRAGLNYRFGWGAPAPVVARY